VPHDEKIHRGGEDSAHVCDTLITVADGVGGWERHGVNPGLFSKSLTRGIKDIHLSNPEKSTR
jgi:serine/threonine protein phosphatase PrpC